MNFDTLTLDFVLNWLWTDTMSDRWETYDDNEPSSDFLEDWWWNDLSHEERNDALDYFAQNFIKID